MIEKLLQEMGINKDSLSIFENALSFPIIERGIGIRQLEDHGVEEPSKIRYSYLKNSITSGAHYFSKIVSDVSNPQKESDEMILGKCVEDLLILGQLREKLIIVPDFIRPDMDKTMGAKVNKEAYEEYGQVLEKMYEGGYYPVKQSVFETANQMVDQVKSSEVWGEYFEGKILSSFQRFNNNSNVTGLTITGEVDWKTDGYFNDLKTIHDVSQFPRRVAGCGFDYWVQAALYATFDPDATEQTGFRFWVLQSNPVGPNNYYPFIKYEVSPETLLVWKNKLYDLIRKHMNYLEQGFFNEVL